MGTSRADRVLLDTNAYLRLGRALVPLFGRAFGGSPSIEFVLHRAVAHEYFQNRRLRTKFDWVAESPYLDDLKKGKARIGEHQKGAIADTADHLGAVVTSQGLTCSIIDRQCLATAMELGLPLATDDGDLQELAKEFEHPVLSTLAVLERLLTVGAITLIKVREVARGWVDADDLPRNFEGEFRELFGEGAPSRRS